MLPALLLVKVLVLSPESEPAPDRFVQQLGIHLSEIAVVERGPDVTGDSLARKVEGAVAVVDRTDAALAVWVERGSDGDGEVEFVLYIVGRRAGRLLVEVFRVPARGGPNLDRALAIKVGEVLDRALRAEGEADAATEWVGAEPVPPPDAEPTTPLAPPPPRRWLLELDGRASAGLDAPSTQLGAAIAGGLRWRRGRLAVESYLGVGVDSGLEEREDVDGVVVTDEITAGAGARLLTRARRSLWIGGQLAGGARFVDAEGTTPRGNVGTRWVVVPTATAAADARWAITSNLELRAAAGVEWMPDRVTLTVNRQPVVDLGRVRPVTELSLVFLMP